MHKRPLFSDWAGPVHNAFFVCVVVLSVVWCVGFCFCFSSCFGNATALWRCHAWDGCPGSLSDCETTMSYSGSVSNGQWWTCWLWTGKGVTRAAWWKPFVASRHYQGHKGGTWHVSARAIPVHFEVSGWMLFCVDSCGWHFGGWQTWFCDEQISELPSKQVWGLNTADGKNLEIGELS